MGLWPYFLGYIVVNLAKPTDRNVFPLKHISAEFVILNRWQSFEWIIEVMRNSPSWYQLAYLFRQLINRVGSLIEFATNFPWDFWIFARKIKLKTNLFQCSMLRLRVDRNNKLMNRMSKELSGTFIYIHTYTQKINERRKQLQNVSTVKHLKCYRSIVRSQPTKLWGGKDFRSISI